MKINTSQISMDASVNHKDVTGRGTRISRTGGEEKQMFQLQIPGRSGLSTEHRAENRQSQEVSLAGTVTDAGEEQDYQTDADQVTEKMVRELTGQNVRLHRVAGLASGERVMLQTPVNPPGEELSFTFESHTLHYEYESVAISSSGSVQLADGRNINFSMDIRMERESLVQESVAWQAAANMLMDPLVLNFDCDLRSLAGKEFRFDLNCDGQEDELPALRPGTGFLALDLNNDERINDGSELFGPASGYGFNELAEHDLDQNGWIDENDPVFSELRIWSPGGNGNSKLISLAEAGVGAISLNNVATPFQLKDRNNMMLGEVAASGIFLTEDGQVRPVQEIKLALKEAPETHVADEAGAERNDLRSFISRMAAVRRDEVQALANLQRRRSPEKRTDELFAKLFPGIEKEGRHKESVSSLSG